MQKEHLKLESQLFRAGAGTGKTTRLIKEVYNLFKQFRSQKNRDPNLIVCTFTRKASQELKERLFEKAKDELNKQKVRLKKSETHSSSLFLNYVQSSSLSISTIDSVLLRFLKKYGHKIHLNPDFQIDTSPWNTKLFESLAEDFIYEKHFSFLEKLPYPFLKDLFLFYFKCRLTYKKVPFYNEKDFEDFCKDENSFLEKKDLFKKPLETFHQNFKDELFAEFVHTDEDISKIKTFVKESRDRGRFKTQEFIKFFKEFEQAGEEFFLQFLEKKKNSNFLTQEDLLLFSLSLLREHPQIAQSFSSEWDYWFIDEYQDTSWTQEQIISVITGFKNVFCVGDPMQSIYLFRGADPKVFGRREEALKGRVQKLDTNYRSESELVAFYNNFFPESEGFLKINPDSNKKASLNQTCVSFITYDKSKDKKDSEEYKLTALKALSCYIQKLVQEGVKYKEIAVLSSKNDHLIEIADVMRAQDIPLILHGSKNFSEKRLILDMLFLLKFLINPYDNDNLKALLRTPYFRFSDQDLADQSYEYQLIIQNDSNKNQDQKNKDKKQLTQDQEIKSFWTFIKEKSLDKSPIQSLNSCLELKKERGILRAFEEALMLSGIKDLSYFQDQTGSSEANLWKFIDLLNKDLDPLKTFYFLMDEKHSETEAPACDSSDSVELMTIHKSKGLEFKHVIIADFSLAQSPLKAGEESQRAFIYDETKQKMAFSVPLEGRDKKKVQSYGHEIYNKKRQQEFIKEKDRLYYVAMTRAKESLAVFIPNIKPESNSWLSRVGFFDKEFDSVSPSEFGSLKEKDSSQIKKQSRIKILKTIKDDKNKIKEWGLREGSYQGSSYSFDVKSSSSLIEEFEQNKQSSKVKSIVSESSQLTSEKSANLKPTSSKFKEKASDYKSTVSTKESLKSSLTPQTSAFKFKSSSDFIENRFNESSSEMQNLIDSKSVFNLSKEKNILFKAHLGLYLHDFLHKLSYQSLEDVLSAVKYSFLSPKDQENIKTALDYVAHLESPPLKRFLKEGFAEWSFKLKKQNVILQGRIDLWAWDKEEIYLFDYKSSKPIFSKDNKPSRTEKQLIFYGWALDEIYKPQKIHLCTLYPLEQHIEHKLYQSTDKAQLESWLNQENS